MVVAYESAITRSGRLQERRISPQARHGVEEATSIDAGLDRPRERPFRSFSGFDLLELALTRAELSRRAGERGSRDPASLALLGCAFHFSVCSCPPTTSSTVVALCRLLCPWRAFRGDALRGPFGDCAAEEPLHVARHHRATIQIAAWRRAWVELGTMILRAAECLSLDGFAPPSFPPSCSRACGKVCGFLSAWQPRSPLLLFLSLLPLPQTLAWRTLGTRSRWRIARARMWSAKR